MIKVLHLGLGRFQRGHQATFYDDLMQKGGQVRTIGVSFRSARVREELEKSQYDYYVWEKAEEDHFRKIDHLEKVLVLGQDLEEILQESLSASVITITVTEKGYLPDDSDRDPNRPKSLLGLLSRIVKHRQSNGCGPLTVISCDNVNQNGDALQAKMREALKDNSESLAFLHSHFKFPNTMVDRIVPATTDEDRKQFNQRFSIDDPGLVVTEPFRQWVLEAEGSEIFHDLKPFGVEFVDDVEPFEKMKLRLLNAAHSYMAYKGQLMGHTYVSEAIKDPEILQVIKGLWQEAIPTLRLSSDFDVASYCNQLIERFQNPQIFHRLEQIAMDGPQKIPIRIGATIKDCEQMDLPHLNLDLAVEAWEAYQTNI